MLARWLVLLCLPAFLQAAQQEPWNVVLISIDTLRADHLGSYGFRPTVSPAIDALARESVQFDNAYMQLEHDLLRSLMKQAYRAASEYLTVDQFKKTVDLRDYEKKFVGNDPDRKWGWDNYFYDQAVTRAFDIARGAL